MEVIQATALREGMVFRMVGQREWRIADWVFPLPSKRVLVCLDDLSQVLLAASQDVELQDDPNSS